MFLRKISQSRFLQLTHTYFVWVAFILFLFLFTNAFSSLDLIASYRFTLLDMMLTYGLFAFLFSLESLAISALIASLQIILEKVLPFKFSTIIRYCLIMILILTWVNIFLTIFNKPIF
jgi:hypothetical protein